MAAHPALKSAAWGRDGSPQGGERLGAAVLVEASSLRSRVARALAADQEHRWDASAHREHHSRRGAKDGVGSAAIDETGGVVEPQRVRVGGHLQALHTPRSQNLRDAVDERGGYPAPPPAWVHKQVFQFEGATGFEPRGEPNK